MRTLLSRRALVVSAFGMVVAGAARGAATQVPIDVVVSSARIARVGTARFHCAIGRGGIRRDKHEGDGATPVGEWPLREVFYRADRIAKP